jgi:hypothetical protein
MFLHVSAAHHHFEKHTPRGFEGIAHTCVTIACRRQALRSMNAEIVLEKGGAKSWQSPAAEVEEPMSPETADFIHSFHIISEYTSLSYALDRAIE